MLDESLLDKNRKYLVGVSGGVDSMALLDMLVKKAYNVIVVHYNYHFREDSDLDENLVRSYCQNHHLPFYVREGDKKPIVIDIRDNKMELKIDSSMGSMNEEIDIEKEGKDILIGFNPKFLIDALKVIDDENIHMYLMNPKAPCFIRDDEETYTYLILPVNISQNQAR